MSTNEKKINLFYQNLSASEKSDLKITLAAIERIQKLGLVKSTPRLMNFNTEEGRKSQKNEIDVIINYKDSGVEVKHRYDLRWYNIDILLETISVIKYNKLGWIYTSKADFVAYAWMKNIYQPKPTGYLIDIPEFRKTRVYAKLNRYPEAVADSENEETGGTWKTLNRVLKIEQFPPKTLYQFDPTKITNKKLSLDSWN